MQRVLRVSGNPRWAMTRHVTIVPVSPLHRLRRFDQPLPDPVQGYGVEQLFGYILAKQAGLPNLADQLLTISTDNIAPGLDRHGLGLSGPEIFAAKYVYQDIVLDQVQRPGSPIREEMQKYVAEMQEEQFKRPAFVMCGSAGDRVWSVGMTEKKFRRPRKGDEVSLAICPGHNVYGSFVLEAAFESLLHGKQPEWGFERLISEPCDLSRGDTRSKTVALVTDSMGKFLKHVHGGMIEAISGGTLSRLMDRVREISHLAEYRALMLHGGVNVAQWQNVVSKQQAIAKFALDVVDLLLNYPRLELIISLAIPHEGTTGEDKAQFRGTGTSDTLSKILAFNEELRREFDNMERVRVVDVGCEAPFWRNGRRDVKVYYKDGFHLNRTGTEWLWRVLTQESPWEVIHTSQGQRPYEPDNRDVPKFVVVDDIAAKNEVEVFYDDEVSCDNDQRMSDGAYSNSAGIDMIREHVAQFITARDGGVPCSMENVFLCGGASEGIRNLLACFAGTGKPVGVMVPIPQYPLYSASIVEFGLSQVNYYLDEGNNWALEISELERALTEAKTQCDPKVLVVINPGNPTGQVLTKENIVNIVKFAHKHRLVLLADEVYQENVYAKGCQFHSFKKVTSEMGPPYSNMELSSYNSISKGFTGECGLRGGYSEMVNFDQHAIDMYKKSVTARLCCCITGQLVLDCMVNPPVKGDPSFELFASERADRLASLANRAEMTAGMLNSIAGFHCNPVQGAMYAFPRIDLPEKLVEKAKSLGQKPDFFYCMNLLERKGICVIPGSGFGQKEGTYHFRTTILPQPPLLKTMLENLKEFHEGFMKEFA